MWNQKVTTMIIILMLQSCCIGGIFQQSFYSVRKGHKVRSNRSKLGDEKVETTPHCAQICRHTEGCLAADHDLSSQRCRIYASFLGYVEGKETSSAMVLYGSCPHEGTGTKCEYFYRLLTKLREGNVFTRICHSVYGGHDVTSSLAPCSF